MLAVVLSGTAVGLLIAWTRRRRGLVGGVGAAQVLASQGPLRCRAAALLLVRLAANGDQAAIRTVFDVIELPLLQALPDCPPVDKVRLCAALEGCAARVANRDLAKRLMTMRNALVG